jgi:ribulose-5-phosphate 4-epimerase/fuculose-1-phosphate aldolase
MEIDMIYNNIQEWMKKNWNPPLGVSFFVRPRNSDYCYVTSDNMKKNISTKDDIIKINLDTRLIVGNKNPSRNFVLFQNFIGHNVNDDLCSIVCHPPNILSYIGLIDYNRELSTISGYFPIIDLKIGNNIDYDSSSDLVNSLDSILSNQITAIKKYGVLCIGKTIEEISDNIDLLEYYCGIALKTFTNVWIPDKKPPPEKLIDLLN